MQSGETPDKQPAPAKHLLDLHLEGVTTPPRTQKEWIVDALVVIVGFTVAFGLALLHLVEP
jgi:hypothetical protein